MNASVRLPFRIAPGRRPWPWLIAAALSCAGSPPLIAQASCEDDWRLEEVLTIGSVDGEDALSQILDVSVGPDGRIYVAQAFVPHVEVFSPDGQPVARIGRAGSGPGEFERGPTRLGWKGDTLWAVDQARLLFFGSDGTAERQVAFWSFDPKEASQFRPGVAMADGTLLGDRILTGNTSRFFQADRLSLPLFSADGAILDTLAMVRQPLRVVQQRAAPLHPLAQRTDVSWLPVTATADGSAVLLVDGIRDRGNNPSFELLRVSISGDTVLRRSVPYEPRRVTAADEEWLRKSFGSRAAGAYSYGPFVLQRSEAENERRRKAAEEDIRFPEHHPPVRQVIAGVDGSIWLLRELDLPRRRDRWEVYDSTGTLQGHVVIEDGMSGFVPWMPRLRLHHASREEVLGSTIDSLGVPYIHRYRVVGCP